MLHIIPQKCGIEEEGEALMLRLCCKWGI